MNKPRIIKSFKNLSDDLKKTLKQLYPSGHRKNMVYFTDQLGNQQQAIPMETEEYYYLIRLENDPLVDRMEDWVLEANELEKIQEEEQFLAFLANE